jgi:hypothetical protein
VELVVDKTKHVGHNELVPVVRSAKGKEVLPWLKRGETIMREYMRWYRY